MSFNVSRDASYTVIVDNEPFMFTLLKTVYRDIVKDSIRYSFEWLRQNAESEHLIERLSRAYTTIGVHEVWRNHNGTVDQYALTNGRVVAASFGSIGNTDGLINTKWGPIFGSDGCTVTPRLVIDFSGRDLLLKRELEIAAA